MGSGNVGVKENRLFNGLLLLSSLRPDHLHTMSGTISSCDGCSPHHISRRFRKLFVIMCVWFPVPRIFYQSFSCPEKIQEACTIIPLYPEKTCCTLRKGLLSLCIVFDERDVRYAHQKSACRHSFQRPLCIKGDKPILNKQHHSAVFWPCRLVI